MHRMTRFALLACLVALPSAAQQLPSALKAPIHAKRWMAITGKPVSATAAAVMYQKGGNAVDAAAAMMAVNCTLWDGMSWGGDAQAIIYNPKGGKVVGMNAIGTLAAGAEEYYRTRGARILPDHGPKAAVVPGMPGGLMAMVAEYGKLSLRDILAPAIQMAEGHPVDASLARRLEANKDVIKAWPYSRSVLLPYYKSTGNTSYMAPETGELLKQPDLAATLRKLVEAEQRALAARKGRKQAIYAAIDRFYTGDIAKEIARGMQEQGGAMAPADLAKWKPRFEDPEKTTYRDIEVYRMTNWNQGGAMLEALNILENFQLKPMGYNSDKYIHTVAQAMSLSMADGDFYFRDAFNSPAVPAKGLLSKEYAKTRAQLIKPERSDSTVLPGDPYPFMGQTNPYLAQIKDWSQAPKSKTPPPMNALEQDYANVTTVQTADDEGWVVTVAPTCGWLPPVIAGKTGIGLTQRWNDQIIVEGPNKTILNYRPSYMFTTPTLALRSGKPYLTCAAQGDQNLLQFFLNVAEFNMSAQQAADAANYSGFQLRNMQTLCEPITNRLMTNTNALPSSVSRSLSRMGYDMENAETVTTLDAIVFDRRLGSMWGATPVRFEGRGIVAW